MSTKPSIDKLAEEELLMEAKRGAARASTSGPFGWQKCPLPKTNKRFLHNTILQSLQANRSASKLDPHTKTSSKPDKTRLNADTSSPTTLSEARESSKAKTRHRPEDGGQDQKLTKKRRQNDEPERTKKCDSPSKQKTKNKAAADHQTRR